MRTLPLTDTQWEPVRRCANYLTPKVKALIDAANNDNYDKALAASTRLQKQLSMIDFELGYMSGFYAALEARDADDEERGVLQP